MKRKGIRNLILDLGGVLADLNMPRFIRSFQTLAGPDAKKIMEHVNDYPLFMEYEKGNISTPQFRDRVRELLSINVSDQAINEAWNSMLDGIPQTKLDLVLSLRKSYVVFLLSNTNELHWNWLCQNAFKYKTFQVEDYFEEIYLSFKMHLIKPDEEIFKVIVEQEGIEPAQTLFIDDLKQNCLSAERLGIQTFNAIDGSDWTTQLTF